MKENNCKLVVVVLCVTFIFASIINVSAVPPPGKGKDKKLYPIDIPQTGQTESYATGDDGDLQMGVVWPEPRFTDNEDGTVTDNLTGLIWQQNFDYLGAMDWYSACHACNNMADDGQYILDGSQIGDWRLPNVRELHSLYDYTGRGMPAPFVGPTDWQCWSSTTASSDDNLAWYLYFSFGRVNSSTKTRTDFRALCVRGNN